MIITLNNTTTREISRALLESQESYSLATGRVLTLIVAADCNDGVDDILGPVRDASHEHPARVLVMLTDASRKKSTLDAKIMLGRDSGGSELIMMNLSGEMGNHLDAVVTPLLLPDTPIVAWWPATSPARPAEHPVGRIAQRRVTNARHNVSGNALLRLSSGYSPGDSDMMWSRITNWRGIVASALDRYPHEDVSSVVVDGPADNPSVDIAAGWLADRLGVPVERKVQSYEDDREMFAVRKLTLNRASGPIEIEVVDPNTISLRVPGHPDSVVAMSVRQDADCLAEELRHQDPDVAYAAALRGLGQVTVH